MQANDSLKEMNEALETGDMKIRPIFPVDVVLYFQKCDAFSTRLELNHRYRLCYYFDQ